MLTIMDSAGDVRPLTNLINTPGNNSQKTGADEQRLFHDRGTAVGLLSRAVIFGKCPSLSERVFSWRRARVFSNSFRKHPCRSQ